MKNAMKEKLIRGESVVGTFMQMGNSSMVECLGLSGLDFFIVDTEHGPFDVESAMDFIRTAELHRITPVVRVREISRSAVLKMLDIGAKALVIPCVETVDQVKKLVEYGKYAPLGKRGFAFGRSAGFGFDPVTTDVQSYFHTCNEQTLILPQCETQGCLDHIEEIAHLEGVDGIFIGPYDLSIGMGKPAQFTDPAFTAAIRRIIQACKAAGKYSFIYCGDNAAAKKYLEEGIDGVAVSIDAVVFTKAYQALLQEVKSESK